MATRKATRKIVRASSRIASAKSAARRSSVPVDPSTGKEGPVCCVGFSQPDVIGWISYGDEKRSIRTYSAGNVDPRWLPLNPAWCDSIGDLFDHAEKGKGYFVIPVSVAEAFIDDDQVFAEPDTYPSY
jgi:hypothetical protein